jgi:hypothetical protein
MKSMFILAACIFSLVLFCSWGFFAHKQINRLAVFTLPSGLNRFFKANINYLTEHAVDPDKRRYADTAEAPRHFLDVERYEKHIDSIPRKWEAALLKYGAKRLNQDGIVPWQIQKSYFRLVTAFKLKDSIRILLAAAAIGHYISDAHVPLHTTENHNGQLTNQSGIHAFWESRLPELFAKDYNFMIGKAVYIDDPLKEAWKIVSHTHSLVDTVLRFEAILNKRFPASQKYSFSERNFQVARQYGLNYSRAYQNILENMVEKQMRLSILSVGSYWYSAWVDAGQPELENLSKVSLSFEELKELNNQEQQYKKGKIIGREN